MTPDHYRRAIAALDLSQVRAAHLLGIDERTSRRYAKDGVPERTAPWVREQFEKERKRLLAKQKD